jgi:ferredoxin-NADP reductase
MTPALELLNLLEDLDRQGTSVIDLVRAGQAVVPWRLYPGESGIFDRRTHCQFYYHSHGADSEAGHFHTVRLFADHTAHLIAISMTSEGWPQALFTLNLWAIGDTYETARNLQRCARDFCLSELTGPRPLVRFVNLMFQAFRLEIERLQDEKFATLDRYRAEHPGQDVFEDRALEILSRVDVDVRAAATPVISA